MHDTAPFHDTSPRRGMEPAAGTLHVALFAGLAAAAGARTTAIPWDGGTVAALRLRLADAHPAAADLLARSAVAIDEAYAAESAIIPGGARVAIIPPVSGG